MCWRCARELSDGSKRLLRRATRANSSIHNKAVSCFDCYIFPHARNGRSRRKSVRALTTNNTANFLEFSTWRSAARTAICARDNCATYPFPGQKADPLPYARRTRASSGAQRYICAKLTTQGLRGAQPCRLEFAPFGLIRATGLPGYYDIAKEFLATHQKCLVLLTSRGKGVGRQYGAPGAVGTIGIFKPPTNKCSCVSSGWVCNTWINSTIHGTNNEAPVNKDRLDC